MIPVGKADTTKHTCGYTAKDSPSGQGRSDGIRKNFKKIYLKRSINYEKL